MSFSGNRLNHRSGGEGSRQLARIVIVDAGPLIALAGTDNLDRLRQLFAGVCLPPAVKMECLEKPGIDTDRIATAIEAGWLEVKPAAKISPQLSSSLGPEGKRP